MDNSAKFFFIFLTTGLFGFHTADFWNGTFSTSTATHQIQVASEEVSTQQILPSKPVSDHAMNVDTVLYKPAQP